MLYIYIIHYSAILIVAGTRNGKHESTATGSSDSGGGGMLGLKSS